MATLKVLYSAFLGAGVHGWTNMYLGVHPLTLPHGFVVGALVGGTIGYRIYVYQEEDRVKLEGRLEHARCRRRRLNAEKAHLEEQQEPLKGVFAAVG